MRDGEALRLGGIATLLGGVGAIVVNILHPSPPERTDELLALVASMPHWTVLHYGAVWAAVLVVSGVALLVPTLRDARARALAEAGKYTAVLGAAVFLVAIMVDGHGYPAFAGRWMAASGDQKAQILWAATAVHTVDAALFPVWAGLFLGLGILLVAAALWRSAEYPRVFAAFGMAGGAMCLTFALSVVFGRTLPLPLWPLGPAIDGIWLTVLGALMLRRSVRPAGLAVAAVALLGAGGCVSGRAAGELPGATPPSGETPALRQPNVLFIAVDDLRPTIGAYGDPYAVTPNLDRLARSGATFLRAYAQQALCNPSRASLMTGLRPDSIRVWDLETDFRSTVPDVVTLPQHFVRHGYRAVQIGKIYHNTIPDSLSWHEEIHLHGFPYDPDAVYHGRENLAIQEARKAALVAEGRQDQAIDRLGLWYLKANATEREDLPDNAYYDGAQTDRALKELATLKAGGPFFFAIGYYRPHLPFAAPGKYWDLYDPDSIASAPNPDLPKGAPAAAASNLAELRGYADFAQAPQPWEGRLSEADARRLKHGYYASVSYVDAQVGRLLDGLDSLGLAENTIVVLWGDHGYKLGEMNGWAKMSNYLIDTHSPLIIRAPGAVPAGLRLEQLVELVDVYPTLSELAGLPVPEWLQGASAVPLLRQPDRPGKGAVFSQFLRRGRWVGQDGIETMGYSMRTERYHYVAWMNWATRRITARELYDLEADSMETTNLASRPELRPLLEHLEAQRRYGWRAAEP